MKKEFVASGLIVTPDRRKAFLVWHNKLQAWLQPGGHVDPNERPDVAAMREVEEETGLTPRMISSGIDLSLPEDASPERQVPTPLCILEEDIPANSKSDAHKHIDLIYLMECEEQDPPLISAREIGEFCWVTRSDLDDLNLFQGLRSILEATLL